MATDQGSILLWSLAVNQGPGRNHDVKPDNISNGRVEIGALVSRHSPLHMFRI